MTEIISHYQKGSPGSAVLHTGKFAVTNTRSGAFKHVITGNPNKRASEQLLSITFNKSMFADVYDEEKVEVPITSLADNN